MQAVNIKSFHRVIPMIYAYTTPDIAYHDGWLKIGYTERQTVEERIAEQTHTADVRWKLAWKNNAMYTDGSGEYFTDRDFHRYLTVQRQVERTPNTEWFHIDIPLSKEYFYSFAGREAVLPESGADYTLRAEQQQAVQMTKEYFESGGTEFLWNAKPRFGKTLTSYDLIRQMGLTKVLIVTNRPSIANSWSEDFNKFIGWRGQLCFVSDTDALRGKAGVLSRDEYVASMRGAAEEDYRGMVAFESLQGLKGSVYFGGQFDKLRWLAKEYTDGYGAKQHGMEFDLLIIDEAQEGVDTIRTDRAFSNISRKYTLYLSGTPFKALASGQFSEKQIFNWSYADEQERKQQWHGEEYNPYEALPQLAMYTYQFSNMIYDKVQKGLDLSGEDGTVDYAFDLNEFFATNESGKFVHEAEIIKFLHALATQEKYPFSTPQLRKELSHTLWLLNRVDSCKALAKLLKNDEIFSEYEIILAAGDGRLNEDEAAQKSFDKVKTAIANHEKTITLSVGQLTVGVTIPEWSGVLMLCNMQSPSSYMQAAFRAQNPCVLTVGGQRLRKETAYVFDFDPARTLIIYDKFANNLLSDTASGHGTGEDRKENIRRLLNFFPVLGEDSDGKMVALDAAQVLSIPRKLKSQEVVRRGFMSNFLFQNISNVFGAPSIVKQIVEKLAPAQEEAPRVKSSDALNHIDEITVNSAGEVEVPQAIVIGKAQGIFGDKIYENMGAAVAPPMDAVRESSTAQQITQNVDTLVSTVKETVKRDIMAPAMNDYSVKKSTQSQIERKVEQDIDRTFDVLKGDFTQKTQIAKTELDRRCREAETEEQVAAAETDYHATIETAMKAFVESTQQAVAQTLQEKPKEIVETLERHKAEQEKHSIEDDIRAHLRGFSRTIPSFIMAYGDGHLTLANFDDYTEDDVFLEVTGITEAEFRFLRDGGDYQDAETGETRHFDGQLFDEVVFDDSVEEFWNKKQELADYFDETHDEDIFDYIPPQKTNQIFTPKWVVAKMVDELEANNPHCFDNPNYTFADLYMKSGLYITEIVKRLFRSERMKELYPDDGERIRHILTKQVYGMAPTRIIYLIATNYILGFDENLKKEILESSMPHFVEADTAEAAKADRLEELVVRYFG
ncbi:MAG: DEAD/DEAH box helicase family protein [Oscillospiraceae bacterium]|nr:DEAD/DEAH box helicase family protein [Oscillospiraceae bacterium]